MVTLLDEEEGWSSCLVIFLLRFPLSHTQSEDPAFARLCVVILIFMKKFVINNVQIGFRMLRIRWLQAGHEDIHSRSKPISIQCRDIISQVKSYTYLMGYNVM